MAITDLPKYLNGTIFVTKSVEANEEIIIIKPDKDFKNNRMYIVMDPHSGKGDRLFESDLDTDFNIIQKGIL